MGRYMLRRLGSGLLTLFLFVTLLFFLVNAILPGDYVTSLGPIPADAAEALREQLGLDRPLILQYFDWLRSIATFDLGQSYESQLSFSSGGQDVWGTIVDASASTLVVLCTGIALAFVLGGWLGRTAGYRGRSFFSGSVTFAAVIFLTAFPPALAFAMEQAVNASVGWADLGTFGTLEDTIWLNSELSTVQVMWRMLGVLVLTALALWALEALVWRLAKRRIPRVIFLVAMIVLPLLTWWQLGLAGRVIDLAGTMALLITGVVLLTFGEVLLVTRAAMDDVMLEDYVMVARAKGLPERQVRDKHAARTALLPVLSRLTVLVPYFLTGLVILEVVFAGSNEGAGLPITGVLQRVTAPVGLGTVLFEAVTDQDTPLIVGSFLVVGVLTLLLRIALDVAHAALDPRIRFGGGSDGD